jgi:hypothetical protein
VSFLGIRQTFPLYEVSLTYDSARARWTQENHTTGKKIELLYPGKFFATLQRRIGVSMTCARRWSTPIRSAPGA